MFSARSGMFPAHSWEWAARSWRFSAHSDNSSAQAGKFPAGMEMVLEWLPDLLDGAPRRLWDAPGISRMVPTMLRNVPKFDFARSGQGTRPPESGGSAPERFQSAPGSLGSLPAASYGESDGCLAAPAGCYGSGGLGWGGLWSAAASQLTETATIIVRRRSTGLAETRDRRVDRPSVKWSAVGVGRDARPRDFGSTRLRRPASRLPVRRSPRTLRAFPSHLDL